MDTEQRASQEPLEINLTEEEKKKQQERKDAESTGRVYRHAISELNIDL
jgi:hypothetical protein